MIFPSGERMERTPVDGSEFHRAREAWLSNHFLKGIPNLGRSQVACMCKLATRLLISDARAQTMRGRLSVR